MKSEDEVRQTLIKALEGVKGAEVRNSDHEVIYGTACADTLRWVLGDD